MIVISSPFSGSQLFSVRYSELGAVRLEGVEECGEGSTSVAEGELGLDVELGHGLVLFGEVEERVVAEALGAAWRGENFAFDGAVADGEDFAVASGGEDAVVAGGALGEGNAGEEGEEVEVVAVVCGQRRGVLVGWLGGFGWVEVVVVGEAGGADAGGSVEGVDFEAGVVGDDDRAGGVAGVVDGFVAGVAFEGGFVFGWGLDLVEVGEWGEGDVRR